MKTLRATLRAVLKPQCLATILIVGTTLALLLFGKADVLLPGYSEAEISTAHASVSLTAITNDPVYAPYKLLVYVMAKLAGDPLLATRLASGFIGLLTLGLFYYGVRQWHSARVAFLSAVLFGSSAWFLFSARHGTPDIMLPFTVVLFAAAGFWFARYGHNRLGYTLIPLVLGLSVYVPGVLWALLLGAFIRRTKDIRTMVRELGWWQIAVLCVVVAAIVAPAVVGVIRDSTVLLQLLGLPAGVPSIIDTLKQLAFVPLAIIAYGGAETSYWIGRLPLLDVFTVVVLALGSYYYFKFRKLDRARLLIGFSIISSVLVALDGLVSISILLPAVYIFVAAGVALLIAQWETVFPNNPLAKSFGMILLSIAVAASVAYNLRAYFEAWPNTPETRSNYRYTLDDLIQ